MGGPCCEDLLTACPSFCLEKASFYSAEKCPLFLSKKSQFLQVLEQVWKHRRLVRHTHTHFNRRTFSLNLTISEVLLAAMADTVRKLNLNTLEGGVLTVEVTQTNTVQELKTMLCEKKTEHPIELRILTAEVLVGGAFLHSESQTVEAAGLLDAEFEGTVIYSRKNVEAATRMGLSGKSFVQVSIPASLVQISARAFQYCPQVVRGGNP